MGMIPVYWDNGFNGVYGFGLFDRNTYEQTQPEIISTIIEAVKNKDPKAGLDTVVETKTEKTQRHTLTSAFRQRSILSVTPAAMESTERIPTTSIP